MGLTKEQFNKLRAKGFSINKIAKLEKRRTPAKEETIVSGKRTGQEKFRDWMLGSEIAQPIRSVFFQPEKQLGAERARAFVSGAGKTLGIPQALTGLAGLDPSVIPPTRATGFETAGKIAGIAPLISGAEALTAGIGKAGLRSAAQGALTMGAISPEENFLDFKKRGIEAVKGGVLGYALQKLVGGFQAVFSKKVKITPQEIAGLEARGVSIKGKKDLDILRVKKATNQARTVLKENDKVLSQKLSASIQDNVPAYKTGFKNYFKGFNKTYGDSLDDIASNIKLSPADTKDWLKETIKRLKSNESYSGTKAMGKLKGLLKRLPKKRGWGFKKLNVEVRKVLQGRSYDGTSDVNNLVYDELRHSFGDYVATYSDDFAKLQAQARPVLELKRFASKIFKPYSQYDTGKLEKLIMKNATGKATLGEKNIISDVNKMLTKSGINPSEINSLASRISSGKAELSTVTQKSNDLLNKIKTNFIKQNTQLKQDIILKSSMVKGIKKGTAKKVLGQVVDTAWKIALYNAIRKMSGAKGGNF